MEQPLYRDREFIRSAVLVIIGAVLGGLLTGIFTIWVALSQQQSQLDLARRAEQEQTRQSRLNALKNNFISWANFILASH
ncbi:MAG: hypothetical protein ACXWZE_15745 [Candidatus Binatia bacterium]